MSTAIQEPVRVVRAHLSEAIARADTQPTVITRNGKPVAAVVSIELLQRYEELDDAETNRIIDERLASSAPGIPLEEVMRETLARDE